MLASTFQLYIFILASLSMSLRLLYQGEHLHTCTSLELIGECSLNSAYRQWWNVSAVGFTIEANLRLISDVSWCLSIHLMFWKDDLMEGRSGIFRSRLQSSVKWSNVSSLETELDIRILSSGWDTIQSSICPCVCGWGDLPILPSWKFWVCQEF